MIVDLNLKVKQLHKIPSDVNEHIPTIIKYGKLCDHITEMGVRTGVSTWGWLSTNPKKFIAYDMNKLDEDTLEDLIETSKSIDTDFSFIMANVLDIEIEETDLLFIDTWHAYKQLKSELELHSKNVKKYICLHDTTSYEVTDEHWYQHLGPEWTPEGIGIWKAVEEFLDSNPNWILEKRFKNNNGFTILKRIK